jgi:isoprenylcysteine carboxyl methyltransferase (ICMT) family protein YpbQ
MKPYFDTNHLAGLLLLVVTLGWGMMEISRAGRAREGATKVGGGGRGFAVLPSLLVATVLLHLAPRMAPAAAIRPGAAAFAVGIVILVAGLVLRGWSIMTLGEYFTGAVAVSADQPVVTVGPYRVLRHPGRLRGTRTGARSHAGRGGTGGLVRHRRRDGGGQEPRLG